MRQHPLWRTGRALFAVLAVTLFPVAASPAAIPAGKPAGDAEGSKFVPGQETRVDDPSLGGLGYYLVYLPKDYAPDRTWPAIVCYHGVDQKPTTSPFKGVLGGKGFIIIGMCYHGGQDLKAYNDIGEDIKNIKRLLPALATQFKLDTRQLFIGGFSSRFVAPVVRLFVTAAP